MATARIGIVLGASFLVFFASPTARAQVVRLCPSLDGAARAACFASASAPPSKAPVIAAAQRCPSLPEPSRAACFAADNERNAARDRQVKSSGPVISRGAPCAMLPEAARASCLAPLGFKSGASGAAATPAPVATALCPSLPAAEREACFTAGNVARGAAAAVVPPPVRLVGPVQCPSLEPALREACFRSGR